MNETLLKQELRDALDKSIHVTKEKHGYYQLQLYADYRDKASADDIQKMMDSNSPRDTFNEMIDEWYMDAEGYYMGKLESDVRQMLKSLPDHADGLSQEEEEFVEENLRELVEVLVPEEHYLSQEVELNITVDTGDGNYDYTRNNWYPHYDAEKGDKIDRCSSLLWLLRQQGYTQKDYRKAVSKPYDENTFIGSLCIELLNAASHMNALTFLVKMSLDKLLDLMDLVHMQTAKYDRRQNPDCGMLTIAKDCECGLFDRWSGAGSLLEIKLEKDVELPIKFIGRITCDDARGQGYSVGSVYGLLGSCWHNAVISISEPKRKEVA